MRVNIQHRELNGIPLRRLDTQVRGLPGLLRTRVYGKAMLKISRQVARIAKTNHPYKDRTGGLTRTLRGRFQKRRYGNLTVRAGAAQVVGGGRRRGTRVTPALSLTRGRKRRLPPGAQAGLVEYGHKPPRVRARPYPYIVPAVRNNRTQLARIGATEMTQEYRKLRSGIEAGTLSRELQRLARR